MTRAREIADGLGTESGEVVPHIKLDILYPAVAGKLLDGSTSHSGDYGTAQSDGRSYYFTSIKGSKPIKDPRIGAYFGSQRHMFKSLQRLLDESSTHGGEIFSVDGREWIRACSTGAESNGGWNQVNDAGGTYIRADSDATGCFLEITGYFNDINFMFYCWNSRVDDIDISVNGTLSVDGSTTLGGDTSVETPLKSRYVDASSVINGGSTLSASLGTTPKINTIRYEAKTGSSEYLAIMGIELIAQDTTSDANKVKIQIPAQTVISYGKKHSISATAQHYDPFNGFVDDTTLFSAKVDTATSLGLGTATTWGAAWDTGSDDHIRPFNGGRVVKWIDSSGNIKTSVTMMPRNAQNIKTLASNEITDVSSTNAHTINFSDDAVEDSLSEVAKRFHIREFGNGSANAGTGGSYPDISMANATQAARGYVMDDGLTSFNGTLVKESYGYATYIQTDNGYWHLTFIGTGIAIHTKGYPTATGAIKDYTIAQNLPYGTHVLKCTRDGDATPDWVLDGVALDDVGGATYGEVNEITIFQPKMPPVPVEDGAVIIADYMLMASFVPQASDGQVYISKGVRLIDASRDILYDATGGESFTFSFAPVDGFSGYKVECSSASSGTSVTMRLPAFGTNIVHKGYASGARSLIHIDTTAQTVTKTAGTVANQEAFQYITTSKTLGVYNFGHNAVSGQNGVVSSYQIATPIHTSYHYKDIRGNTGFESPYLRTLVGGDRNMEQTNLVVSPSGKTWDEVTRDTSYIGKTVLSALTDTDNDSTSTINIFDDWRGIPTNTNNPCFNKDFAIAYDRFICLVDGEYEIVVQTLGTNGTQCSDILLNGSSIAKGNCITANETVTTVVSRNLVRGDYIQIKGSWYESIVFNNFHIKRV